MKMTLSTQSGHPNWRLSNKKSTHLLPAIARACAAVMLAGAAGLAHAGAPADGPAGAPAGAQWVPVSAAILEHTRGGFTLGGGLEVSLGIERLVSINGNTVSRTTLQLGDMSRLSAEQARQTGEALSSVNLIQNGHDNIVVAALAPLPLGGTVIQNSLNDQLIRSQTVIHSSVNSMGLLKTLNFQGSLGDAITHAAGSQ